jgi:flagellar assembly protein FliH
MNLSKVLKDSEGFVPENIIAVDIDRSPVWEQLAKKVDHPGVKDSADLSGGKTSSQDSSDTFSADADSDPFPFDSDFSSPEHEEPASPDDKEDTDRTPATAPEQIDLDALAEEHFNKGVQAGIERMESDYNLAIRTLQSACEQLNSVRETILRNSSDEMQNLVLQIAEKIIRQSVVSQQETIRKTVEESIQKAVKSEEFIIIVNPDEYETIQTHSAEFIQSINGLENIIIKKDSSVESGGCLIESSTCTVDATLTSQLQVISDLVKQK